MITRKVFASVPVAILTALLLSACTDDVELTSPDRDTISKTGQPTTMNNTARPITAMTRNLYMGTEMDELETAPAQQVPFLVAGVWSRIQQTNFPERARAIALEIANTNPDLIGLQEADVFRVQEQGDFMTNPVPNATAVKLDYVQLLLDALSQRGLNYHVVVANEGVDVELPMVNMQTGGLSDLRYTEYDVILARGDVPTGRTWANTYSVNVPIVLNGLPLDWKRGWVGTEAVIGGDTVVFVSTHQEIQRFQVGPYQAQELIQTLTAMNRPVILVGDLNSAANASAPPQSKTAAYQMYINAGFEDMWLSAHPSQEGLTCCHAVDLMNTSVNFDQRLDLVLVHQPGGLQAGGAQAWILGNDVADRTFSGLWPSDHAGVVATLHLPRRAGQ